MKIKGTAKIVTVRYHKDEWGIVVLEPVKIEEGTLTLSDDGTFVAKGAMVDPKAGMEYNIIAQEITDPKWGKQYDIQMFTPNAYVDEQSTESKRKYLETLFTEAQVDALYKTLPDPFIVLKEHNAEELIKVKGCGVKSISKWFDKFESNYYLSRLYVELGEYELTASMVKKLVEHFKSPDIIIKRVKENPYTLTEVGGVGFKKADEIALKTGISEWDARRVGAFIVYTLDNNGMQGNSYIKMSKLIQECADMFTVELPETAIFNALNVLSDKLWWSGDKTEIGLRKYYDLEVNIATELKRLAIAPLGLSYDDIDARISMLEEQQGWQYTDQQRSAIKTANANNLTIINGAAGCVDCDTEFFTGEGWKRIADYQKGDKVLQYNEDGTAKLVEPLDYIKQHSNLLYHFETKYGLSQTLSENHNVVYVTSRGHLNKIPMHEVIRRNNESANGFSGKFITAFQYEDKGLPLFDNEIRLMVAIFADGHFEKFALKKGNKNYRRVKVNLKKERKKQRLEMLLRKLQIPYKKKKSTAEGYHVYDFHAPYIGKHYIKDWYHCSRHQREIIADEVMKWDGNYKENNRYSTTNKHDADFIQFVFASLGYRASLSTHNRVNKPCFTNGKEYVRKSIEYSVSYTNRTLVGMAKHSDEPKTPIVEVIPKDGFEYCFTVPSGMLVLRKDNKIFITGNCGKTTIAGAMIKMFSDSSSAACCLSGKAAARLGEAMGTNGATIHRLLGFNPKAGGFMFDKNTQLGYRIVVIDEISMIGGRLFYDLLQAIRSGTKVIMLGDTGQLEAIGECNVASDIINSGTLPVVTLDKIHRQAAKSAIITESLKVRNGKQIIQKDYAGVDVLGENQDMLLDCYSDKNNTTFKMLQHFKEELKAMGGDVQKVQMIVPMKARTDSSVWSLNKLAQELCNPLKKQAYIEQFYTGRGKGQLRVGDKVICVKNNYKDCYMLEDGDIKTTPIFNGFVGTICEIEKETCMIIDFVNVGRVVVPSTIFNTIELAYAITVHKSQGSQTETILVGLDYGSYTLLSRELVYTAITRAMKKCVLVAQNVALRYAVTNNKTSTKKTHLQKLLNNS